MLGWVSAEAWLIGFALGSQASPQASTPTISTVERIPSGRWLPAWSEHEFAGLAQTASSARLLSRAALALERSALHRCGCRLEGDPGRR